MKLYYIETMNPRKVCATAKQVRSPIEYVRLEVGPRGTKSPEYLAINPNGRAPTLVDGAPTLWESVAICGEIAD
jgi:glutathione S-transferase